MGAPAETKDTVSIRFAGWRSGPARLALAVLLALLVAAALVPLKAGPQKQRVTGVAEMVRGEKVARQRDDDLALYDRVIARIGQGENYYAAAAAEHRAAHYPLRPGVAVRLPTLAYLDMVLGPAGQIAAALILLAANLIAWWRRFGDEGLAGTARAAAIGFLLIGVSLGVTRYFFVLHELWAGMLLSLAFALHRARRGEGRKWIASLAVAALALAIREHSLPFVLLMGALAAWRRDWREAGAWAALAALFTCLLALHLNLVAQQVTAADPHGPSWLALRGLGGWLGNVVLSSNLRLMPHWLGGPLLVLAIFGWCAWDSAAGRFGALLQLGYGAAFMIAGRGDNYYWGFMVSPTALVGLAFVPAALRALAAAALRRN
jgi:hypothetical protein